MLRDWRYYPDPKQDRDQDHLAGHQNLFMHDKKQNQIWKEIHSCKAASNSVQNIAPLIGIRHAQQNLQEAPRNMPAGLRLRRAHTTTKLATPRRHGCLISMSASNDAFKTDGPPTHFDTRITQPNYLSKN